MVSSKLPLRFALLSGLLSVSVGAVAQTDDTRNTITTAVPILTLSPDSRSAALGEAGVAISPDANSSYYNAGKLGFVQTKYSFSPSYTPWLRTITDDMGLAYLSGYTKLGQRSAIAGSLMYFDLGSIYLRNIDNRDDGTYNPKEYAVSVSYGQKLSEHFGVGVTARYIRSNLVKIDASTDSKPGNAAAVDLGAYYNNDLTIGAGEYDFLPTNLKLGTAITRELDAFNKLTLVFDVNKLLVPTPYYEQGKAANDAGVRARNEEIARKSVVSGILGSFSDAPGGFKEELREINLSTGLEYWYNDLLAVRAGYFYENKDKGDRQYLSFGAGVRYQVFGVDGAYLVPNSQQNPLSQTIRISLHFNFNKAEEAFGPSDSAPAN
jgi:hypothetical protein